MVSKFHSLKPKALALRAKPEILKPEILKPEILTPEILKLQEKNRP